MTTNRKSLSGATIISCFFDRTLRNVKSLPGSKSRTALLALSANWLIRPAYWTVVVLSNVLFTGIPETTCLFDNIIVLTAGKWSGTMFGQYDGMNVSTTPNGIYVFENQWDHSPSLLTTIVPTTPLCPAIRFNVSSTSCDWNIFHQKLCDRR